MKIIVFLIIFLSGINVFAQEKCKYTLDDAEKRMSDESYEILKIDSPWSFNHKWLIVITLHNSKSQISTSTDAIMTIIYDQKNKAKLPISIEYISNYEQYEGYFRIGLNTVKDNKEIYKYTDCFSKTNILDMEAKESSWINFEDMEQFKYKQKIITRKKYEDFLKEHKVK